LSRAARERGDVADDANAMEAGSGSEIRMEELEKEGGPVSGSDRFSVLPKFKERAWSTASLMEKPRAVISAKGEKRHPDRVYWTLEPSWTS
jgi:hypothetical protein